MTLLIEHQPTSHQLPDAEATSSQQTSQHSLGRQMLAAHETLATSQLDKLLATTKQHWVPEPTSPQANQLDTIYCKYSGLPIYQVAEIFPTARHLHCTAHWIFDKPLWALNEMQGKLLHPNHQQRSLLVLAYLLRRETTGTLLDIQHPISFPVLKLQRSYTQLLFIFRKLSTLTPEARATILEGLPTFTTQAIVTTSPNTPSDATIYTQELASCGNQLLDFILDTLYLALGNSSTIFDSLGEDADLSALIKENLLAKIENKQRSANVAEYWNYILAEVKETFDCSFAQMTLFREQLANPTNRDELGKLRACIEGLKRSAQVGKLVSIPVLQFTQALIDLDTKIAEFQFSNLADHLDGSTKHKASLADQLDGKKIPTMTIKLDSLANTRLKPAITFSMSDAPPAPKKQNSTLARLSASLQASQVAKEKKAATKKLKLKQFVNKKLDLPEHQLTIKTPTTKPETTKSESEQKTED